jgi:hypothetical protein
MSSLRAEMTHGDKAKAKTGKSSQASAKKVSTKAASKESNPGGKGDKGDKNAGPKQPGSEKAVPAAKKGGGPAKGGGSPKDLSAGSGGKAGDGSGFSNPVVGAAFKRALKKYPNAFRKLTD